MTKSLFRLCFIFILFSNVSLYSASMYDPGIKWRTLSTAHFDIHYEQELESTARSLALIAERAHSRLVPKIGWAPWGKTQVVLVDKTDIANGFAMPYPRNRIEIYPVRPEVDSSLNNFDEWLELVFVHEYTHVLNIDSASGIVKASRNCPGRCCFPNLFQPIFLLEGNALYHESQGPYGRNNSHYTDMVIRTEILNNKFKNIDIASVYPREWPRGQIPYLYGGLFVKYLHEKYGEKSVPRYFMELSDDFIPYWEHLPVPWLYNIDCTRIFGKDLPSLWEEWRSVVKQKYNKQIEIIKEKGITTSEKLTEVTTHIRMFRLSPDSKTLYYISNPSREDSALLSMDLNSGKTRTLCRVNYPSSLTADGNGTIVYTDPEYHKSFSLFNDVYTYSKGKTGRETDGSRIISLDVSKNGKTKIFIRFSQGKYSLHFSEKSFKNSRIIIPPCDIQFSQVKLSPDSDKALITIKDFTGGSHIAVVDIKTSTVTKLTMGTHHDIDPSWNSNGKTILFSSDRDSVYNLYEYDIATGNIYKLSSVITGAFSPQLSEKDDKIYFLSYDRKGMNISRMDYPSEKKPVGETRPVVLPEKIFTDASTEDEVIGFESTPYDPMEYMAPAFIIPLIFTEEYYPGKNEWGLGFITMGTDSLFHHQYTFSGYIYPQTERGAVFAEYLYSAIYPDIFLGWYDTMLFYGDDDFPWKDTHNEQFKRSLERDIYAGMLFPRYTFRSRMFLQTAYYYERDKTDWYIPGYGTESYDKTLARAQVAFSYDSTTLHTFSVCPEDGIKVLIIGDSYNEKIGSDLTYSKIRGEAEAYIDGAFKSQVILARIRGGFSYNTPEGYEPYNLGKYTKGERGVPETDEDAWGLRGYPAGSLYGTRMASVTAEYRMPLYQQDRGAKTFPLLYRDLWITCFGEWGNVWDDSTSLEEFRSSAGLELNANWTLGYRMDITTTIGVAKGFNDPGETQIYFSVGTIIEGSAEMNHGSHRL